MRRTYRGPAARGHFADRPGPAWTDRPSPTAPTTSVPAADATFIDITILFGTITPTNTQARATIGRPVVLTVSSDVADQLHVHSVPEHIYEIQRGADEAFEFTVGVLGRVDVELHDLSRTVVTIDVRP